MQSATAPQSSTSETTTTSSSNAQYDGTLPSHGSISATESSLLPVLATGLRESIIGRSPSPPPSSQPSSLMGTPTSQPHLQPHGTMKKKQKRERSIVAVGPISSLESNKKRNKSNVDAPLESYKEWGLPIYREEFISHSNALDASGSGKKKKKKKSYEPLIKFELRLTARFTQGQAGWDECIVEASPKSSHQLLTSILMKKCTPRRIIRKLCKRFWNTRKWGVISCIRRKNFFHKSFWERKLQDRGATMHVINGAIDVLLTKYNLLEPVRIWFSDGTTECGVRLVQQAKDLSSDRAHQLQNPNYVPPTPKQNVPSPNAGLFPPSGDGSGVMAQPQAANVLCTLLADAQFQSVVIDKPRILSLLCQSLGLAGHEEAFLAHTAAAAVTASLDEESRKRGRESDNGDYPMPHAKRAHEYREDHEDMTKRADEVFVESCRVSNDGQEWYVIADEKTPGTKREMTMENIMAIDTHNTRMLYFDAIQAFRRDLPTKRPPNGV